MLDLRLAEALGNRFLVCNHLSANKAVNLKELIFWTQQQGLDQLVIVEKKTLSTVELSFYNRDGSQAEACGNGTRCAALMLWEEAGQDCWRFITKGGLVKAQVHQDNLVALTFPPPIYTQIFASEHLSLSTFVTQVSQAIHPELKWHKIVVGNPHLVLWVSDTQSFDLGSWGPLLEQTFPGRVNVSFAQLISPQEIALRVWERGAGATKACGTAALAAHVSARLQGLVEAKTLVHQQGGGLTIQWEGRGPLTLVGHAALGTPLSPLPN